MHRLNLAAALALALSACERAPDDPSPEPAARPRAAYVESEVALSSEEQLRVLVLPSELDALFDRRCLLYVHRTMQRVALVCLPDELLSNPSD